MQAGNSQIHVSVWLEWPVSGTSHGGGTSGTAQGDRALAAARLWDKAQKGWRVRLAESPPKEEKSGLVLCRVILFNDFLIPS